MNTSNEMPDEIDLRDAWENTYGIFIYTLSVLEMPPAEQCTEMGNYNVAWELQHDGFDVDYLLDQEVIKFTEDQKKEMRELSSALHALGGGALKYGPFTWEKNLEGMSNPGWQPVREIARKLIITLEPRTLENRKYLNMS